MDSKDKSEDKKSLDDSRFELDGVVAEMMIEVEEASSPTKSPQKVEVEKNKSNESSPKSSSIRKQNTKEPDEISDGTESDAQPSSKQSKGLEEERSLLPEQLSEDSDINENTPKSRKRKIESSQEASPKTPENKKVELSEASENDSEEMQPSETQEVCSDVEEIKSPVKKRGMIGETKLSKPTEQSSSSGDSPKIPTNTDSVEDKLATEKRTTLRGQIKIEDVKSVSSKTKSVTKVVKLVEENADEKPRRGRKKKIIPDTPGKSFSVLSAKAKAYNLYPKGTSRLDSFIEVKEELKKADLKHLKILYRLMFDQFPPRDIEELKSEILQFQGFTFNKRSDELDKRQKSLKKLPDSSILEVCKILDLKKGTKDDMISDIIKFLLKPIKIIFSFVDPFQPNLQPVVKLERLQIDDTSVSSSNVAVKSSKRKRIPSTRLSEYVSDIGQLNFERMKMDTEKNTTDKVKGIIRRGRPRKNTEYEKEIHLNTKKIKIEKESPDEKAYRKKPKTSSLIRSIMTRNKTANKLGPRGGRLKQKFLRKKVESSEEDETDSSAEKPIKYSENQDWSSEVTLSSDEAKEEEAKIGVRRRKAIHRREGKPLSTFSNVKDNIMLANFSALQRLHILLFGASDKMENLKPNILAFGGFPFLEGSEEWKQKEFLLSLLAPNTLTEYLDLLCIEHFRDDDNPTLINRLMKFLAAPKVAPEVRSETEDKSIMHLTETTANKNEIYTQVVSSEPVVQAPNIPIQTIRSMRTRNATKSFQFNPNLKKAVNLDEVQEKVSDGKVAAKGVKELLHELKSQKPKAKIKYCQAKFCPHNSKDNPDLSFFSYPNDPIRLEKWLTNIELKTTSKRYNLFLCSKHFDSRAFTNTYKNARLLSYAVPTIPAPGSTRKVVHPCLDGYAAPDTFKLVYDQATDKTDTQPSKPTTTDNNRVPLQKLMEDLSQKRTSVATPQTDLELLEALLQTVYKRRALKEIGAKISIPNKGTHTRLGELDNVKFLVVTSNYNDLDVLHHLIYMTEASKSKVRKNILDFAGFNFAEDSSPYQDRMEFLKSLGYNISKRIAFLLGLCPYVLDIDQQDLNELIMYFLMSPCKSKQVPIRHLPQNFFSKDMPEELCNLLEKHGENESTGVKLSLPAQAKIAPSDLTSPEDTPRPKAKKSFRSSVSTPSSKPSPRVETSSTNSISNSSSLDATSTPIPKPVPLDTVKKPLGIGQKLPLKTSTLGLPPSTLTKSSPPATTTIKPSSVPPPIPQSLLKSPPENMGPQEYLIQQQTPDGQQKTYKLIRLPTTHPLNSSVMNQAIQSPQLHPTVPVPGAPLPPGIILFKNNPLRGAIVSPGGFMSPMNPTEITDKVSAAGIIPPTGSQTPKIINQTPPVIQLGNPVLPAGKVPLSSAVKPPVAQIQSVAAPKVPSSGEPENVEEDASFWLTAVKEVVEGNQKTYFTNTPYIHIQETKKGDDTSIVKQSVEFPATLKNDPFTSFPLPEFPSDLNPFLEGDDMSDKDKKKFSSLLKDELIFYLNEQNLIVEGNCSTLRWQYRSLGATLASKYPKMHWDVPEKGQEKKPTKKQDIYRVFIHRLSHKRKMQRLRQAAKFKKWLAVDDISEEAL